MIKAVFIDIDNTLLDFNKSAEQSMKMSFEKRGLPFSEKVFPAFKRINDGLWLKIEKGEITRDDLHDVRWNLIFAELGISFDGHITEKDFLDNLFNCAVKVDGALETVKYLSGKYVLCSASNAFYKQQVNRLTISGLMPYFKHTFVSEKLGYPKPTEKFFDKCFEELEGITVEETVIIGDSISADIEGGKNYGLTTVWFNFEGKAIPEEKKKSCDYTVKSLYGIKDIL